MDITHADLGLDKQTTLKTRAAYDTTSACHWQFAPLWSHGVHPRGGYLDRQAYLSNMPGRQSTKGGREGAGEGGGGLERVWGGGESVRGGEVG